MRADDLCRATTVERLMALATTPGKSRDEIRIFAHFLPEDVGELRPSRVW